MQIEDFQNIIREISPEQYPTAVQEAQAILTAAEALRDTVVGTQPVDLASIATPKDVARLHAAAVKYDTGRDIAVRNAQVILEQSHSRLVEAWFRSLPELDATFAAPFDAAAAILTSEVEARAGDRDAVLTDAAQYWNPDSARLREALATLDRLRRVRDDLANLSGQTAEAVYSIPYEHDSRTLWFESGEAHRRLRDTLGADARGDRYYVFAAARPGVRIVWQTRQQQEEQPAPAAVRRHRQALLATTN